MRNLIKKSWNDPVGSKVISAGIIGLFTIIGSTMYYNINLVMIWDIICNFLREEWYYIPVILILTGIILTRKKWWKLKNNEPDWFNYKTDEFFGVKWVWDWNKNSHHIVNIVALCPVCDYELDSCDRFPAEGLPGREVVSLFPTGFQCKKCGFKKTIPEYGDLATLIPKEITYIIRRGVYNKK